jgi:hypothetical protein
MRESLFSLTLDPDNPNFERSLGDGDLRRTIAHEVHHCMRMAGPGYGWTLGEALVSEGLAGQFVHRLFGSPPEPWECAVSAGDWLEAKAEIGGGTWINVPAHEVIEAARGRTLPNL